MASREELEWWNKFADVMAEQWMLTPAMNAIIRAEYEQDYADYLFRLELIARRRRGPGGKAPVANQ